MLIYRYSALTEEGKIRSNNEDNFYIDGIWKKDVEQCKLSESAISRASRLTASVCDGMGGEAFGEEASLIAVETISKYDRKEWSEKTIDACIQEANRRVCETIRQRGERSGSTMCLLLLSGNQATAINLGDSRIYFFRKRELKQLSIDHSVVGRMIRQGQITEAEARKHPRRHQITQYLGIEPEEMRLSPSITESITVLEGDRFLLCSDGLTDMLTDQEIRDVLQTESDTDIAATKLKERAIAAGGRDNVTIVLIDIMDDGEEITADTTIPISALKKEKRLITTAGAADANSNREKKHVRYFIPVIALALAISVLLPFVLKPKTYKVTVNNGTLGHEQATTADYKKGTEVTITANDIQGYTFIGWDVVDGEIVLMDSSAAETSFTMGNEEVELTAVFAENKYTLKVEDGLILGNVDSGSYTEGTEITIQANEKEGFDFVNWEVIEGDIWIANNESSETTVRMGSEDAAVKAIYREEEDLENISFGTYVQDKDLSNGQDRIEWLVLDEEENRKLLISKYSLDLGPYYREISGNGFALGKWNKESNTEIRDVRWETCTLRRWLNTEFKKKAFTDEEQQRMLDVINTNNENAAFGKEPYEAVQNDLSTQDQIFLLSVEEVQRYFVDKEARKCEVTEYVNLKKGSDKDEIMYGSWWLRSSDHNNNRAAYVNADGIVRFSEDPDEDRCIRPALWISCND